jgi:hypothetical protein
VEGVTVAVNVVETVAPDDDGTAVKVVVVRAFRTLKFNEDGLLAYRYGGAVKISLTLTLCAPTVNPVKVSVAVRTVVDVLVDPNDTAGCWRPSTVKTKFPSGTPTLEPKVVVAVITSVWP